MRKDVEKIKDKIGSLFSDQEQLGIAYLYGSRSRGEAGPRSDYDFAVYLTELDPVKQSEIRASLISALIKKLGTDDVDVVILNDLESPELKYNIIRDGEVLFEREPFRVLVEPRILNDYFDFMYLLRKYHLTTV